MTQVITPRFFINVLYTYILRRIPELIVHIFGSYLVFEILSGAV